MESYYSIPGNLIIQFLNTELKNMELQEAGHPLQAWIAGGWSSPTSMDCRILVIPTSKAGGWSSLLKQEKTIYTIMLIVRVSN